MSLRSLLSLDDDGIECVPAVVRIWCDQHGVPWDCRRGREAMSEAIRLAAAGERSPEVMAEALSRHMRVLQYKQPTE